jgi:hypothetical protein
MPPDSIAELARSPLTVETFVKTGLGLDSGINPTIDLLHQKYFIVPDPENPDGANQRLRRGEIARKSETDVPTKIFQK